MNKPTLDMDAEIKSHYEPNSEDDEAWRHGLDDLSGCGHDFIDALIAERDEMKKEISKAYKIIDVLKSIGGLSEGDIQKIAREI